ncbi:MAG: RdgB/HAM1 family non-canonical purine NTP pyrophosphatase [Rhizomicrobium sp.]
MRHPRTLVIASHNAGKVGEIAALLAPLGVETRTAAGLGLAEPEETGATFAENARLKAAAAADALGLAALADDSGLVVPALGGAPGIYSARWAGPEKDFSRAMMRLETELKGCGATDGPEASFVCALAFAVPGEQIEIFEGEVHGRLRFPPKGTRGFGYDPIFVANGMEQTFGEIDPVLKHTISHRARAFAKLMDRLSGGSASA